MSTHWDPFNIAETGCKLKSEVCVFLSSSIWPALNRACYFYPRAINATLCGNHHHVFLMSTQLIRLHGSVIFIAYQCVKICILTTKAIFQASENNSVSGILYINAMRRDLNSGWLFTSPFAFIESGIGFTCPQYKPISTAFGGSVKWPLHNLETDAGEVNLNLLLAFFHH